MGEHRRKADGRRVFTTEFKRATVQRVVAGEKTVAELSRELDIAPSVIRSWKRFAEAGATTAVQAHEDVVPASHPLESTRPHEPEQTLIRNAQCSRKSNLSRQLQGRCSLASSAPSFRPVPPPSTLFTAAKAVLCCFSTAGLRRTSLGTRSRRGSPKTSTSSWPIFGDMVTVGNLQKVRITRATQSGRWRRIKWRLCGNSGSRRSR